MHSSVNKQGFVHSNAAFILVGSFVGLLYELFDEQASAQIPQTDR